MTVLAERAASERCEGAGRPFFLLAEPPRKSGGRSMRAVKNNLLTPSREVRESESPHPIRAVKSSLSHSATEH
jgi:hypothetical protein